MPSKNIIPLRPFSIPHPPPASCSISHKAELNSGIAVPRSAHYLNEWKPLWMIPSCQIPYYLTQETTVLIRCLVGFRFKWIAEDLGEIKGVAFQLPPILSAVTKVPHEHPGRKGWRSRGTRLSPTWYAEVVVGPWPNHTGEFGSSAALTDVSHTHYREKVKIFSLHYYQKKRVQITVKGDSKLATAFELQRSDQLVYH